MQEPVDAGDVVAYISGLYNVVFPGAKNGEATFQEVYLIIQLIMHELQKVGRRHDWMPLIGYVGVDFMV